MQFNLNSNVTLFLSVRKGLENCLLHEIKHNKLLNNINRIHLKREHLYNFEDSDTQTLPETDGYLYSSELREVLPTNDSKWLNLGYSNKLLEYSKVKTNNTVRIAPPVSTHLRNSCDIYVQPGGLEVKCNFDWLLKSSLFVKSAESVWLRIGNPFRCHTEDQLVKFISRLPWNIYIPEDFIDKIPLRVITRNSTLWSSHNIDSCVRKGIKLSFENTSKTDSKFNSIQDYCISVTLNRNTCYLAFQFSGRLSPRFYNFQFLDSKQLDYTKYIPSWSLTDIKKKLLEQNKENKISQDQQLEEKKEEVLLTNIKKFTEYQVQDKNKEAESGEQELELEKSKLNTKDLDIDSFDSKRKSYINFQNLLTNDYSDTSDSLIAAFLQNKDLFKALDSKVETVWDPFCGNGLLICELMSLILSVPNYITDNTLPINSALTQNFEEYKNKLHEFINSRVSKKPIKIVGSDTNLVKLSEANSKILRFLTFYKNILGNFDIKDSPLSESSTLFKSYSFYPLSIHNCSLEGLSHYMNNTLILTKIPFVDIKDKNKFETIKLYKQFGQIVSSKTDWKGVFVISRGRLFEYQSGLEWKTLLRSTNSKSVIKLLKWTGRTRDFRSVDEKLDQLNDIDFK